jgi:excisionase family DNA binding protein
METTTPNPARAEYLTAKQLTELLQVSKPTLYRYLKAGFPKPIRMGPKAVRWERSIVESWMRAAASK